MIRQHFWVATLGSSLSLTLSLGSAALAAPFTGSTSATWGTPSPSTGGFFSGVGTNVFVSGSGEPNVLTFTGNGFSAEVDTLFKVGELDYFNGVNAVGSVVDSVPLSLKLGFTNPGGVDQSFTYNFKFDITLNYGDREGDADRLLPLTTSALGNFVADGVAYTLRLGGFSQDGGATIVPNFKAYESESTKGSLYAKITRDTRPGPGTSVPEPEALVGLMGISTVLWSTRRKAGLRRPTLDS